VATLWLLLVVLRLLQLLLAVVGLPQQQFLAMPAVLLLATLASLQVGQVVCLLVLLQVAQLLVWVLLLAWPLLLALARRRAVLFHMVQCLVWLLHLQLLLLVLAKVRLVVLQVAQLLVSPLQLAAEQLVLCRLRLQLGGAALFLLLLLLLLLLQLLLLRLHAVVAQLWQLAGVQQVLLSPLSALTKLQLGEVQHFLQQGARPPLHLVVALVMLVWDMASPLPWP